MRSTQSMRILRIGALLLWTSLVMGGQGYSGTWGRSGVGPGRRWIQLRGYVLCAGCTLNAKRAVSFPRLYQLNHRLGQVVMKATSDNHALPYRRLWLKGDDRLFERLAAEENLFRELEISGVLREYLPTTGILELPRVQVLG
jgi:hypothetical protein